VSTNHPNFEHLRLAWENVLPPRTTRNELFIEGRRRQFENPITLVAISASDQLFVFRHDAVAHQENDGEILCATFDRQIDFPIRVFLVGWCQNGMLRAVIDSRDRPLRWLNGVAV